MVRLPWRGDSDAEEDSTEEEVAEALVSCDFQDGTLSVYEDRIHIERVSRSKFGDKWIAMNQVRGVEHSDGIVIGYLQIQQVDFDGDEAGFLSSPVDENTIHFGHGRRDCAEQARDAIREQADVEPEPAGAESPE
jgi:hypothetical protein